MNNGYEYYYLFGLDIPLDKYGLGKIKQPKIIDYLNYDIDIENFYLPFIMNDVLLGRSKNKESVKKAIAQLGSLTFLLVSCFQERGHDLISLLLNTIKFLYRAEKVEIIEGLKISIDDEIFIDNDNFDILSNVILEMIRIDKKDFQFEKTEDELDPITQRFEMLRREHQKRTKGKTSKLKIVDSLNILVHFNGINGDYNKVLNMTLYQVRNSLETLGSKNNYETFMKYKLSSNYDVKEEVKIWSSQKIIKNSSINKDV